MKLNWYIFHYKNDKLQEPIGRVHAVSLIDAKNKISIIKNLSKNLIDNLFLIKLIK